MPGVVDREKYNYDRVKTTDPKTGKTRTSYGNGDAVAKAMLGLDEKQLERVVRTNKLIDKIGTPEKATNIGLYRMALGNSLRAMVRRGEPVTIGEHTIKRLDQKVAIANVVKDKPAKASKPAAKRSRGNGRKTVEEAPDNSEAEAFE